MHIASPAGHADCATEAASIRLSVPARSSENGQLVAFPACASSISAGSVKRQRRCGEVGQVVSDLDPHEKRNPIGPNRNSLLVGRRVVKPQ